MPVKNIQHPETRQHVYFGRNRTPKHPYTRLRMSDYSTAKAVNTPVPAACDYTKKAGPVLRNVLMNDKLGCCTASGAFHIDGMLLGNANNPTKWTDAEVVAFYSRTSGYVVGDPSTDNGANEEDVLNLWKANGLLSNGDHKIAGYLSVNHVNVKELQQALYLFENLYFGMELPDKWVNPFPSKDGYFWKVASGDPDPNNGHCVVGVGYNASGVLIDSWGLIGTLTYSAIARYCSSIANGQVFVVASKDSLIRASQKAPNGMDWTALTQDFVSLGGIAA